MICDILEADPKTYPKLDLAGTGQKHLLALRVSRAISSISDTLLLEPVGSPAWRTWDKSFLSGSEGDRYSD